MANWLIWDKWAEQLENFPSSKVPQHWHRFKAHLILHAIGKRKKISYLSWIGRRVKPDNHFLGAKWGALGSALSTFASIARGVSIVLVLFVLVFVESSNLTTA